MKRIPHQCQLSAEELKSVLCGNQLDYKGKLLSDLIEVTLSHDIKSISNALFDNISKSFQILLEKLISAEFTNFLEEASRSNENGWRNGYYFRIVHTFLGDFTLQIPRTRFLSFKTNLLPKYGHSLIDLQNIVISYYGRGMSLNEIAEHLCQEEAINVSRETIRKIISSILGEYTAFNERRLDDCPIVYLDATYISFKRSTFGGSKSVEKEGILVAIGINTKGCKEVLGFQFGDTESLERWKFLLDDLKERGVK